MKKVLVSLLVLALAMTSVFAAVNFSGEFVAGYTFQNVNDEWATTNFGQDNIGTDPLKLNGTIADEDGLWSITMKGVLEADSRLSGEAHLNVGQMIFGSESDISMDLGLVAKGRVAGLNAYNNKSGLNLTRIRTIDGGLASLTVGYTDLVQVQVAGSPITGHDDLIVSALVKPLDGLAVSAGYVMNGESKLAAYFVKDAPNEGAFNAAVDVNLGALIGLDFDLGLTAGDKYEFDTEMNLFAATVYGGIDLVDISAEYALITQADSDDPMHAFNVAANFNVLEGLSLNVYTGAFGLCGDYTKYEDVFYVGGNVGYAFGNVGVNLNVQYAADAPIFADGNSVTQAIGGDIGAGAVKAAGFSITPSVTLTF